MATDPALETRSTQVRSRKSRRCSDPTDRVEKGAAHVPFLQSVARELPRATMQLYEGIVAKMTRTPTKFHYIFNMRDLSRVYQGLWQAKQQAIADGDALVRFWRWVL